MESEDQAESEENLRADTFTMEEIRELIEDWIYHNDIRNLRDFLNEHKSDIDVMSIDL